jgi:hypothetical protein
VKANYLCSNNGKFFRRTIEVLVYYVTNAYLQGTRECELLNSLSKSIMKGGTFIDEWPATGTIQMLSAYIQKEEKDMNELQDDRFPVNTQACTTETFFASQS